MKASDLPNLITVLRMALVPPVVLFLVQGRYGAALLLFAVAGVSDGLDGFLARHFGWRSRLGSVLDPLADKLLLVSCYLSLGWTGLIPAWLVAAVLGRDLIIVAGAAAYHRLFGPFEMQPSLLSKANTVVQIVLVLVVVMRAGGYGFAPGHQRLLEGVVLATTLLSGLHYVVVWGGRALRRARG